MWQYFRQFFSEENLSMSILGDEVNENSLGMLILIFQISKRIIN